MAEFNLVMCAGHCGSRWFANALDSQPGVAARHAMRMQLSGRSWQQAYRHKADDPCFDMYWLSLRSLLETQGEAWDVNSWMPWELSEMPVPVTRVVYLVRNGIMQLDSLLHYSSWHLAEPDDWQFEHWLKRFYDVIKQQRDDMPDWVDMSYFDRLCLLVAGNEGWPLWMRQNGISCETARIEDLTTSQEMLREYVDVGRGVLKYLQATRLNRHRPQPLTADETWANWTKSQRYSFNFFCGAVQERLKYDTFRWF